MKDHQQRLFVHSPKTPEPAPVPYAAGSETSREAAEAVRPRALLQRDKVFAFIRDRQRLGATDAEGQAALGMMPNSYTPRRGELADRGLVCDSQQRRLTPSGHKAVVWIAAENLPDKPL